MILCTVYLVQIKFKELIGVDEVIFFEFTLRLFLNNIANYFVS